MPFSRRTEFIPFDMGKPNGMNSVLTICDSVLDLEQLHLKVELGVRRDDVAGALGAVAEIGRNDQLANAAHLHAGDAFVPALDDPAGAERELKRLAAVLAAVELLAVLER